MSYREPRSLICAPNFHVSMSMSRPFIIVSSGFFVPAGQATSGSSNVCSLHYWYLYLGLEICVSGCWTQSKPSLRAYSVASSNTATGSVIRPDSWERIKDSTFKDTNRFNFTGCSSCRSLAHLSCFHFKPYIFLKKLINTYMYLIHYQTLIMPKKFWQHI